MKSTITNLTAASLLCLALITAPVAMALPSMSSGNTQLYNKNQGTSLLRTITITEDAQATFITPEYGIKITIPQNLKLIFDKQRTSVEIETGGTALEKERIDRNPSITFEDRDKSMRIPIHSALAPGETIILRNISVKGFNDVSSSGVHLLFTYSPKQPETIADEFWIKIDNSNRTDTTRPEVPENLKITQLSPTSLKFTWENPTDLDLYRTQIYRGESFYPTSFYKEILPDITELTEENLTPGETYRYLLKSLDNRNESPPSTEVSITLSPDFTPEPEVTPVESTTENPIPADDSTTDEPQTSDDSSQPSEPTICYSCALEDDSTPVQTFTDVPVNHPAYKAIEFLSERKIIKGKANKVFAPNDTANRAELMKMIVLGFELPLSSNIVKPHFPDTPKDAWYTVYTEAGYKEGILKGDQGKAVPNRAVTHAEGIAMMMRAMKADLSTVTPETKQAFTDVSRTDWFFAPVMFAQSRLITEKQTPLYSPHSPLSRSDLAQALYKAIKTAEN